ncbi:MAG: DMP19 family protein [Pyrinomonadaceae bacterium]|nr:DMP19 family protein [Pyrinomonadaceae bacterium]
MSIQNEEKVVRFVERFQAAVAGDGFEGFFRADAGDYAQATLNALLVMQAINTAALLRQAMWVFEGGAPPPEQNARREALSQIDETGRSVLRKLDGSFRHYNDELTSSLARYSRSLNERYCVV